MNSIYKSLTGFGFGIVIMLMAPYAFASGGSSCGTMPLLDEHGKAVLDEDGNERVEHLACSTAPIDFSNKGSLQRGATMFMNYCVGCHTAKYVRHSRIAKDLDIPPELVERYLLVTADGIGDHIDAQIDPEVQASWFGAAPPDLSLETRLRGDDWVYTYLLSFYEDPSRPWGANNLVLENVAMPHVLLNLQNELGEDEYRERVGDLVNFMAWMGEPVREDRQRYGFFVLIFLAVLLIPVYLLNKEYWKDVK